MLGPIPLWDPPSPSRLTLSPGTPDPPHPEPDSEVPGPQCLSCLRAQNQATRLGNQGLAAGLRIRAGQVGPPRHSEAQRGTGLGWGRGPGCRPGRWDQCEGSEAILEKGVPMSSPENTCL